MTKRLDFLDGKVTRLERALMWAKIERLELERRAKEKRYGEQLVKDILNADKSPPEASFSVVGDLMRWLEA